MLASPKALAPMMAPNTKSGLISKSVWRNNYFNIDLSVFLAQYLLCGTIAQSLRILILTANIYQVPNDDAIEETPFSPFLAREIDT
jgi:hypothetical protein